MASRTMGVNCTSSAVFLADTSGSGDAFQVQQPTQKVAFSLEAPADIQTFHRTIRTILDAAKNNGIGTIAILKCSSGPHGSSVEAIKAEGIFELLATNVALDIQRVAPQSLRAALGCAQGEKWQAKARALFNSSGTIKNWSGTDGAVAAAYKATLP